MLRLDATGAVQKELEEVCSRRLYEQTLENIECVLQTSVRVRTSANPYGLQPASQNTVNNRRSTFRSICKEVTGSEPEQPCNKDTAQWVTQVDRVIAAMDKIYDSFGSWSQAFILFMQTLRLLRLDDLSTVYYERFRTLSEEKSKDKKSSKTLLSEEEVESIREAVEQAADDALRMMDEATVQSALAMLFIWGTSSDWQPQPSSSGEGGAAAAAAAAGGTPKSTPRERELEEENRALRAQLAALQAKSSRL